MKNNLIILIIVVLSPFVVNGQVSNELHNTAMECWELADFSCAEIYLRDLVKLEKDSELLSDYYLKLGIILSESGSSKEALKMFKLALKQNPHFVDAYVKRGELYSREGNIKKARADFDEALKLEPGCESARNNIAQLMSENN